MDPAGARHGHRIWKQHWQLPSLDLEKLVHLVGSLFLAFLEEKNNVFLLKCLLSSHLKNARSLRSSKIISVLGRLPCTVKTLAPLGQAYSFPFHISASMHSLLSPHNTLYCNQCLRILLVSVRMNWFSLGFSKSFPLFSQKLTAASQNSMKLLQALESSEMLESFGRPAVPVSGEPSHIGLDLA